MAIISSCNIYKQIPNDNSVLVKNQVNILGQETNLINDFFYKDELYKIPLQKPNKKILGIPVSQHIWAYYNKRKLTDFSQYMKTKIGNAPVLFDSSKLEKSRQAFQYYYFNLGYFDNIVDVQYQTKNKKTIVQYNIQPNQPYRIRKIFFDTITEIQKALISDSIHSYLQEGDVFDINNFKNEIERLTYLANEKGYFSFNKDHVKYVYDTFKQTHELNVYVKILEESDTSNFQKYTVDSIYLIVNPYSKTEKKSYQFEVSDYGNIKVFQENPKNYKDEFLTRFIYQYHDSFYSKSDINYSIQRLSELNNFKLINSSTNLKDNERRVLDLYYILSPYPRRNFSFGQYVYGSSLGFAGAQPTLAYTNRNLTKRADKLSLTLSGAIEANLSFSNKSYTPGFVSRTDISIVSSYNLEKFILPILFSDKTRYLYNRTSINSQYTYSRRLGFYDIHNIGASAGYEWSVKRQTSFSYFPFLLNYILFPESSVTTEFRNTLNINPGLRSTFSNAFILGSYFQFNHFVNYGRKKANLLTYKINVETAGNSIYLIDKVIPLNKDADNININGIDVSQYFKTQLEVSTSNKINRITSFHARAKAGFAFPFGNSSQLPYIKNFFIGGPYSLRAFQPRTIGPGNYNPYINDTNGVVNAKDQLGNIALELNAEYRFNIISYFKGALFIDAGNIWNSSSNFSQSDLSVFKIDEFYKQLYVGGGFGLRIDANYFVLRLDFGIPFRVPYLQQNDWVIKDAKPLNGDWIRNNLLLNFAVGYPF